ncbi:MAG: YeeE/YedE family protein [Betaproteobacteria bacterium]|nr:YeeE/YedE family protein [Betaproteobacteria bacterium]
MSVAVQFIVGLIFGLGLVIAGMSNPAKVQNFLDLAGTWDPSLALVMLGAIAVAFVGFRVVLARSQPIMGEIFHLPATKDIDSRIIIGPAIFGIGWGLAGLCPGPAFTALGGGSPSAILFTIAMFAGMFAAERLAPRSRPTLEE